MGNEIDVFFVLLVIPSVYLYLMRGLEHVQVFLAHEACFFFDRIYRINRIMSASPTV